MKNWSLIQRNTAKERISSNTGLRVWHLCTYSPMVNCFRVVETALSNADSCQSEKLSSTPSYLELGFSSIQKMPRNGFSLKTDFQVALNWALIWSNNCFERELLKTNNRSECSVSYVVRQLLLAEKNLSFAAKKSLILQWTLSGKQIKVSYNLQYSSHLLKNTCHVTPPPSPLPTPQCWFTCHPFAIGHFEFPRSSVSKRGWVLNLWMILYSHANKTRFHKNGCGLGLILKVRVFVTRKWPIKLEPQHWERREEVLSWKR